MCANLLIIKHYTVYNYLIQCKLYIKSEFIAYADRRDAGIKC